MKKISILSVCALVSVGAVAQEAVVKEAERAMKKDAGFEEVVKIITPAFTDPATAQEAITYYVPGKAAFKQFDSLIGLEALGKLPENGTQQKVQALLGGYDYFMKALPLDSVPDEKGKVKPKYSKDIVSTIGGHYNDFNAAAVDFWNLGDYANAYRAWDIYVTLPERPEFVKALPYVPADTLLSEIMYNQALAAWQNEDLPGALNAFMKAKAHGYHKKNLYDYAIAVATNSGNTEAVKDLATEAHQKYGTEDSNYIGFIINYYIQNQDYNKAISLIDEAIANNPNNAQYYVIKGILFEQDGVEGNPKDMYGKAADLDPNNAQALYNYGRMFYNEALEIYNNAPADEQEFGRIFVNDFKPVMLQAVDLFERAYNIDQENIDNLKLLEQAYYMLNDDSNYKYTQQRLNE